jgi:hypothetical protein
VIGNGGKKGVQCQLLEAAFLTFLIDLADWNLKKILFSWSKDSIHDDWFLGLFLLDDGSLAKNYFQDFTVFLPIIVRRSKERCNTM